MSGQSCEAVQEGEVPLRPFGDIPEKMAPRLRANRKPVGQAMHVVIAQRDDKSDLASRLCPRGAGDVAVTPPVEADRGCTRAAKASLPPAMIPTTARKVVREVKHQWTVKQNTLAMIIAVPDSEFGRAVPVRTLIVVIALTRRGGRWGRRGRRGRIAASALDISIPKRGWLIKIAASAAQYRCSGPLVVLCRQRAGESVMNSSLSSLRSRRSRKRTSAAPLP